MKHLLWAAVALAGAAGPVAAGEVQFKPIDTDKLLVKPSRTVAALSAATINLVGQTAANQVKNDGYVKTINNVFGFKRDVSTPTQPGRSPIPIPAAFPSTGYKSYNTPVMPSSQPVRR